MQTSAMMAVRAVTLLACLAAVPLLAIFGKNVPAAIRSLVQNYSNSAVKTSSASVSETDPPVFRPGLLGSNTTQSTPSALAVTDGPATRAVAAAPARPLVPISATSHRASASQATSEIPQPSATPSTGGTAVASFPPGYFREAELRLRELGATYYLLETLGSDMGGYRFFCKVAPGPKSEETLAFFATDGDPLAAMQQVIRQVEGWRTHANR